MLLFLLVLNKNVSGEFPRPILPCVCVCVCVCVICVSL